MSTRVYSEINVHITWHTKGSVPMIGTAMEAQLHSFLRSKVIETRGAYFHAVGGVETHIHLTASVKPSVHLDEWIGQLKGASSHEFGKSLQWQTGYGIVSFGTKDLKWVVVSFSSSVSIITRAPSMIGWSVLMTTRTGH